MQNEYSIKPEDYGLFVTNQAFEDICKRGDLTDSIDNVLEQAGRILHLDSVQLYEYEAHSIKNTFSWYKEYECGQKEPGFSYDNVRAFLQMHDYEKMISVLPNTSNENVDKEFQKCYIDLPYCQVYVSAILEEGKSRGFVSFERKRESPFSKLDLENCEVTVNVLSVYLLKHRAINCIKKKLEMMRDYDRLTKLATSTKFQTDVKAVLQQQPNQTYAVVSIDFKNFKYMKEIIGESAADGILIDFAAHLKERYAKPGCIARVEADRFLVLLPFTSQEEIRKRIYGDNEQFRRQIKKKSVVNNVTLCAGVSKVHFGEDISIAIDNAILARKCICIADVCNVKFFDQEIKSRIRRKIKIEEQMQEALDSGEFVVYLQPKIELATERVMGAEALVRWVKSEEEVIAPIEFISIFEKNGFIIELDYYVYEQVCRMIRRWMDQGRTTVPISVNVSRVHLNDEHFVEKLKSLIERYRIPPKYLELELTESIFLYNKDLALSVIHELREYGFLVSIDDFGSGYSSLNLLRDINSDILKLDREFFRTGTMKREDKIIVTSIVNMAKQLNMKVLSEGVETRSQSEFLQSIHCDMAQGFFYSRPMPVEQFEKLL